MAFRFFIIVYVLSGSICFSQVQDSIAAIKKNNDTIVVKNNQLIDSTIQDNPVVNKVIEAEVDSTSTNKLKDNEFAAQLDEKWYEELYSNNLFDTIYNSVQDLDYKPVDYPELPTDVLKARLKELNARTPFNVEYNPSLESVIKGYLKNRRNSIQKLITLSAFYFPMFERELDLYDIPLEVKY